MFLETIEALYNKMTMFHILIILMIFARIVNEPQSTVSEDLFCFEKTATYVCVQKPRVNVCSGHYKSVMIDQQFCCYTQVLSKSVLSLVFSHVHLCLVPKITECFNSEKLVRTDIFKTSVNPEYPCAWG